MSRHRLTPRDHKAIGRQLSRGVPFHRALKNIQGASHPYKPVKHSPWKTSKGSNGVLQNILTAVEAISGLITLLAVLNLYATYGFGLLGTIVVFGYLVFWEFVGAIFSTAEKKIPSPLRIIWRILTEIFEALFG